MQCKSNYGVTEWEFYIEYGHGTRQVNATCLSRSINKPLGRMMVTVIISSYKQTLYVFMKPPCGPRC